MLFPKDKLQEIVIELDSVINSIQKFEKKYKYQIQNVHPKYVQSAKNLIHYLALRSFDINLFQKKLDDIGLPNTLGSHNNILSDLLMYRKIINKLLDIDSKEVDIEFLTNKEAEALLNNNSKALFGNIKNNRKTAVLVTQPTTAAIDKQFIISMFKQGMDCARVNCAHDDELIWQQIIANLKEVKSDCKVMMDLGGPKLRTGKMKPGHKVIHIKPTRNTLGQVVTPAKVWIAPYGVQPPLGETADVIIPVNKKWLQKTKAGSFILFKDSRSKKCKIAITKKTEYGRWGVCNDSAFVTTGTLLNVFFEKKSTSEIHSVYELLPLEEAILLYEGDLLKLTKESILGEPAVYDTQGNLKEIAHISCSFPGVFDYVKIGEKIYFNDGKIGGVIKEVHTEYLLIETTLVKKTGGKLKADKGINLPFSDLRVRGLTLKDKKDLEFIVEHADAVNFSFVNNKQDVAELLTELKRLKANIGIVLKIETQESYRNLPSILLKAMENYPIGVMIARGDLAIETGWKNFAIIQEEILQLCDAALIPDIWATQVLENMAKKGIPTRAEITDAAMAQRADCVMLNKGPYIEKSVRMLDKVLCKMQEIQTKKRALLPKLEFNEDL